MQPGRSFSLDELFGRPTVWLSGGARRGGISRRTLELFVAMGARVAFIDWDLGGHAVLDDLPAGRAYFYCGDLRDPDVALAFAQEAVARFGPPDAVLNVAGGADGKCSFDEIGHVDLKLMFDLNVMTAWNLVKAALPWLRRNGGVKRIVNVGTVTGRRGDLREAHYGAVKACLDALTRAWAGEFAADNISVNLLAPGSVPNPYSPTWCERLAKEQTNEHILKQIAARRLGAPDDIAVWLLILGSNLSPWTTGQVICVDGGMIHAGRSDVRSDGRWFEPEDCSPKDATSTTDQEAIPDHS